MEDEIIIIQNYINGEFKEPSETLESVDPSTNQCNARVPEAGKGTVNDAVLAAKNAFKGYLIVKLNL